MPQTGEILNDQALHCMICASYATDSALQMCDHLETDRSRPCPGDIIMVNGYFHCHLCPYNTNLKANFQLHTRTDKHLQRVQLVSFWVFVEKLTSARRQMSIAIKCCGNLAINFYINYFEFWNSTFKKQKSGKQLLRNSEQIILLFYVIDMQSIHWPANYYLNRRNSITQSKVSHEKAEAEKSGMIADRANYGLKSARPPKAFECPGNVLLHDFEQWCRSISD
jgi:hypothetical protein